MTRQPAGKPRDKRKGRRRPVPRPPAAVRPRVAPISASAKTDAPVAETKKPRGPNPMDFRYVNAELRRILLFVVGMVGLLVVLSFILR